MKAFNLILIAGALVVASCDDESMNLDKARIVNVVSRSEVNVELIDSIYQLSWEQPEIYTQRGAAIAAGKGCFSYDVCLSPAYTTDTLVFIKTVDSCGAVLLHREVEDALGRFSSYVQDYRFCVCLSDTTIPNNQPCYSAVQMANNNTISRFYETYNHWFTQGVDASVNDNNEAVIESKSNKDVWDVQFCNVFHGLNNQSQGNRFSLSFDIKWIGDSPRNKEAYLTIYTGKYVKKKGSDILVPDNDQQWSDANTQLIFDDGLVETMSIPYSIEKYQWERITFEGEIGEMGADIIAIQINLSGYEGNGVKHTNTDGTFYIRNMEVRINDEISVEYFMNDNNDNNDDEEDDEGDEDEVSEVSKFGIFNGFNEWFLYGASATEGTIEDGVMAININVSDNEDPWAVQFRNIFVGLPNQTEGKSFQLSFDVEWVGDADSASFNILAGSNWLYGSDEVIERLEQLGYNYNLREDYSIYIYNDDYGDYMWDPTYNTELIYEGVFMAGHNKQFTAYKGKTTPIEWGGTIGEKGKNGIGVQMNLAITQWYDVVEKIWYRTPNNGTFLFSNIEVKIGGKPVKSY
jgi:hypothetical protein